MKDIRFLADALDTKFKLPNGWRFGWDGILGLIPGFGNGITGALSFYILIRAALLGCPPAVIIRMTINVLIDNILDKIPGLGLVFDFVWKANTKNIKLMEDYFAKPHQTNSSSKFKVAIMIATLVLLFIALVAYTISLLAIVFGLLVKGIPR